jgi:hypothetical protein
MDDIKFHENGNDHCWISDDLKWGVIKRFSGNQELLLYKEDINQFYTFTGFEFDTWQEIQDYIKNHQ